MSAQAKQKVAANKVLLRPHVTEKSATGNERGVYTFIVDNRSTKTDVVSAIKEIFGVTPEKVNITKKPSKSVTSRGRRRGGVKAGYKKAVVYLKEGDNIEVV